MSTRPSSAATGSAAMCAAAATPKSSVSSTMRGRHLRRGPLHGVGHADAGVDAAIDAQRGQHLGIGRDAGLSTAGEKQ